jgi:hypothetical protein
MKVRSVPARFGFVALIGAALAMPASQVSAATLAAFSGTGSGLSLGLLASCPAGLCPGSDSCSCVPITGTGKAGTIGVVNFATTVVLDGTRPIGNCEEAFGAVTLTSKGKASNALVLDYVGSVCVAAGTTNSGFVLNAAYFIDGAASTGKFAKAAGSGNIAGSEDITSGAILGNINGTLAP